MRICFITPEPEHHLVAAAVGALAGSHRLEVLDPRAGHGLAGLADVYLLKALGETWEDAVALARQLEEGGARVVNSAAATSLVLDRAVMADTAAGCGLPFAATRTYEALEEARGRSAWPVVIKNRKAYRHDLLVRVDGGADFDRLLPRWAGEAVVVQPFTPNDGWDYKLWVIGGRVFAERRPSPMAAHAPQTPRTPLPADALPSGWADLARRTGEVFGLQVYGVDLIRTGGGEPLIVDVNAFPGGMRGQHGAPDALAAVIMESASRPRDLARQALEPG